MLDVANTFVIIANSTFEMKCIKMRIFNFHSIDGRYQFINLEREKKPNQNIQIRFIGVPRKEVSVELGHYHSLIFFSLSSSVILLRFFSLLSFISFSGHSLFSFRACCFSVPHFDE